MTQHWTAVSAWSSALPTTPTGQRIKFFDATGSKLSTRRRESNACSTCRGDQESQHSARQCASIAAARSISSSAPHDPNGMNLQASNRHRLRQRPVQVAPRRSRPRCRDRAIGCSPNGRNINDGCGSNVPELLQLTVPGCGPVGIALDATATGCDVDELGRCWTAINCSTSWQSPPIERAEGPVVGT